MKQLFLIIAFLLGFTGIKAQTNPFEELGYTPRFATLSNGQFNEFHDNDTIVQIGSVLLNTKSKQIVAFVQQDTLYSEATLQPDIVSRWISPDPLADHPNQIDKSPYQFAWNNPIYWDDPDGRCPWCVVWAVVEVGLAVYDAYETGTTIIDPKASTGEKLASAGGFVLGAILPGGGYGKGAKETVKAVDKVVDAGKVMDKARDVLKNGKWTNVSENMSDAASSFQKQITGVDASKSFKLNDVKFDGVTKDGVLLDAKSGMQNFVGKDGNFQNWFNGTKSLTEQATRQLKAADGAPIQWHFENKSVMEATQKLFKKEGIEGINLIHTPKK